MRGVGATLALHRCPGGVADLDHQLHVQLVAELQRADRVAGLRRGPLQRQHQARLTRDALAGDVERRAVIDRDPHDRQADRDVDAVVTVDRVAVTNDVSRRYFPT